MSDGASAYLSLAESNLNCLLLTAATYWVIIGCWGGGVGGAQGRAPLPGPMGGVDASPPGRAGAGGGGFRSFGCHEG